jgi:hypothetical protein
MAPDAGSSPAALRQLCGSVVGATRAEEWRALQRRRNRLRHAGALDDASERLTQKRAGYSRRQALTERLRNEHRVEFAGGREKYLSGLVELTHDRRPRRDIIKRPDHLVLDEARFFLNYDKFFQMLGKTPETRNFEWPD